MEEQLLHSDRCMGANSNLYTESKHDSTTNISQTVWNNNNSMSSVSAKTSSTEDDDYLSDIANPFETASSKGSHKSADTNAETNKLSATFDKLDLDKVSGRQINNEDMMSLSGQDMPEMESMKSDLCDDEDNQFKSEELFQDSATYDFLLSIGNSNKNTRDFSKESLFVKFDPLVGKQALPSGKRPDSNANAPPVPNFNEHSDQTRLTNACSASMLGSQQQREQELSNANVSPAPTSEPALKTPIRNSAIEVLDRLISLTPTTPKAAEPVKEVVVKVDAEKMQYIEELKQLRQIITKQEEEFEHLQKQLQDEKTKVDQLSNKEQALVKRIAEKTKMEQQMSVVMSEYEKNIAQLISDRELEKQKLEEQVAQLTSERDVAMQHLSSVESAFSDVHQKYERCKVVIEQFKANEETLKADNASLREIVKQQDNRYDTLKAHAISQLDKANADLEALKRKQEMEVVKCTALLKKADLKTISLQEALTQKQKENEELMAICDGLIQKVG